LIIQYLYLRAAPFFLKNTSGVLSHMGCVNMVTMKTWVYSVCAVYDRLFLECPIKSCCLHSY
jgi:hypothetical protein